MLRIDIGPPVVIAVTLVEDVGRPPLNRQLDTFRNVIDVGGSEAVQQGNLFMGGIQQM